MFTSILVPLDETPLSRRIMPYVEYLARVGRGRVRFLHVTTDRPAADHQGHDHPGHADDGGLAVREVVGRLRGDGIEATFTETQGEPGAAIVKAATECGADLIAMSTHGRGEVGRVLHGSIAEEVLRACEVPLLLATATCERLWVEGRGLRVLVPLDGSPLAEQALVAALDVFQGPNVELRLLRGLPDRWEVDALGFGHRVPPSPRDRDEALRYLEKIAAPLRRDGLNVMVFVEEGDPVVSITRLADDETADIVVMATHGRGSLTSLVLDGIAAAVTGGRLHFVMGSIAAAVVEHTSAPVLLMRPDEPASSRPASHSAPAV